MKDHDHEVSFEVYDSGAWLRNASTTVESTWDRDYGNRFAFCPSCGTSLSEFWLAVDAAREAYDRQQEAEHDEECQALAIEEVYSNTPPT